LLSQNSRHIIYTNYYLSVMQIFTKRSNNRNIINYNLKQSKRWKN
jgi:hypothetical protein